MAEILIAKRDTVLVTPGTGEKFRLIRGRTLADARHPAAAAYPENFMPVQIELNCNDPDHSGDEDPAEVVEEYRARLHEALALADSYRAQLTRIVDELMSRGLMPADIDTDREGWLVEVVAGVLDERVVTSEADFVLPPAKARVARAPRKVLSDD